MVAGVALMSVVTGLAWWRTIDSPAGAPRISAAGGPPSLAVLPLTDMSAAGGSAYLGDGLSEELAARLAQIPGLRVASRTSAFNFKDQNIDVRKIGQALGVRHLLEGSVRREGDAVRVTVKLVDAESGFQIWSGSYDREWRKLLVVQQDIAEAVAVALQVVLVPGVGTATAATEIDPRALDPYLAGLALLRQPGDPGAMREATRRFAETTERAPEFAGAHAGLCRARLRQFEQSRDPAVLAAGELSCRRAIELDPSLIDTEKALARLRVSSGDYAEAESRYRGLLERYPLDADVHIGLADALAGQGEQDLAEQSYRRAAEVEPAYWAAHSSLGGFLFQRGRIGEAVASFEKVTALVPASAQAWSNLGGARQLLGDFSGALTAYQTSLLLEPSVGAHSNLATSHFYLGQFDQAVQEYERALALGGHDHTIWGNLGDALWQVPGRRADSIEAYRKAIELAEAEPAQVRSDPMLLAQLGYYRGRVGDLESSIGNLDQALATGADHVYVQYYRAVAATDRGDVDEALEALGRLVELGYPVALLRSGPEFGSLVGDERFKAVLDRDERA
jgi:TolB-like protein/tetratricopeptide (TPR) repeat protein